MDRCRQREVILDILDKIELMKRGGTQRIFMDAAGGSAEGWCDRGELWDSSPERSSQ